MHVGNRRFLKVEPRRRDGFRQERKLRRS
jgi:hypothetical protein